jgi:hypothetical protein
MNKHMQCVTAELKYLRSTRDIWEKLTLRGNYFLKLAFMHFDKEKGDYFMTFFFFSMDRFLLLLDFSVMSCVPVGKFFDLSGFQFSYL